MIDQLLSNQIFAGGMGVAVFGALMALCRNIPGILWARLKGQFIVEIDVLGTDPVFQWLQVWLGRHAYTQQSRLLTASADPSRSSGGVSHVVFTPAPGYHFLRYRKRWMWVSLQRVGIESANIIWRESLTLRVAGRDSGVARMLIEEAREAYMTQDDGRISIYRANWNSWSLADRPVPRPLESVILDTADTADALARDLRWFYENEVWYRQAGVPYRRGYLFEGVPGSGKSSAIIALAGELGRSIYLLSLADKEMSDRRLHELLWQVPDSGMVVLEDIDAACPTREESEAHLTLSGLLNALDGIGAKEGRVLFLTTNHVEKLDPALIRPGRVDVRLHFGHATHDQARRLYQRFNPGASLSAAERFAAGIASNDTMADLQGALIAEATRGQDSLRAVA